MGSERSTPEEKVEALSAQEGGDLVKQSVEVRGADSLGRQEAVPSIIDQEITIQQAVDAVLDCMLAGIVGPAAIGHKIGFTPELVEAIQNRPEMAEAYAQAKKSFVNSAIERLERNVHRNLQVMEDLTNSADPRVRMEAARDQLNRTPGLAPGARVEIGPAAYKKMVERYLEPDAGEDNQSESEPKPGSE